MVMNTFQLLSHRRLYPLVQAGIRRHGGLLDLYHLFNLAEVAARAANKGTHTSATQSVSVTPLSLSAPVTNKRT